MFYIPTNDAFHQFTRILQIHQDKELIIDMFAAQGIQITKSQLGRWDTLSTSNGKKFQAMPADALNAFLAECFKRRLIEVDED